MSKDTKNNFKTIQSQNNEDYFLKLHLLLNPENMKLILKQPGQKLEQMTRLKEIYSNIYGNSYSAEFKEYIQKTMRQKITLEEAKELCQFINALGITEKGLDKTVKVFYDNDKISRDVDMDKIDLDNVKSNNNNKNESNIKSKSKNSEIPQADQKFDLDNINKFVKRNSKEERPSLVESGKPNFVKQINQVKGQKVSLNTFTFDEKDNIKIERDNNLGETIVNLKQVKNTEALSPECKKDKITDTDKLRRKVIADREVINQSGEIIHQENVYRYNDDEDEVVSKNNKKDKIENKDNNNTNETENENN